MINKAFKKKDEFHLFSRETKMFDHPKATFWLPRHFKAFQGISMLMQ